MDVRRQNLTVALDDWVPETSLYWEDRNQSIRSSLKSSSTNVPTNSTAKFHHSVELGHKQAYAAMFRQKAKMVAAVVATPRAC